MDNAIAYGERSDERWSLPEWLRIKARLLLFDDSSNSAEAERVLIQGLDCARRQGACAWERRCATSLARLQGNAGRDSILLASHRPVDGSAPEPLLARA
jgi:hypothetical protein